MRSGHRHREGLRNGQLPGTSLNTGGHGHEIQLGLSLAKSKAGNEQEETAQSKSPHKLTWHLGFNESY